MSPIEQRQAALRGWLVLLTFGVLLIPSVSLLSQSPLSSIIYLLPAFSVIYWIKTSDRGHDMRDPRFVYAFIVFALIPLTGAMMHTGSLDHSIWFSAMMPALYLAVFIPVMQFSDKSVNALTIIFAITLIMFALTAGINPASDMNWINPRGPLESDLAFPLGAITVYCLMQKKALWSLITLTLFGLSMTPMAVIAMLILITIIAVNKLIVKLTSAHNDYPVAAVSLIVTVALLCVTHNVTELEKQLFSETIYQGQNWANRLFGNGLGEVPHSSSFALYYYNHGIVGLLCLMTAFLIIYTRNSFGIYLLIYNIVIMLGENTFDNYYHQITCFILIAAIQYETEHGRRHRSAISEKQPIRI